MSVLVIFTAIYAFMSTRCLHIFACICMYLHIFAYICIFGYNQCKLAFMLVFDATTGGHEHVDSGVLYRHRQLEDESNYPATARTPDRQLASHGHIVNGQDGPQRAAGTFLRQQQLSIRSLLAF